MAINTIFGTMPSIESTSPIVESAGAVKPIDPQNADQRGESVQVDLSYSARAVVSRGYADREATIEAAKRKVQPAVGIDGADKVVDRNGNIDSLKLLQLLAQQK